MEWFYWDSSPLKSKGFYLALVFAFATFSYYQLVSFVQNNFDEKVQLRRFVAMFLPIFMLIFFLSSPITEIESLENHIKRIVSSPENGIVLFGSMGTVLLLMLFGRFKVKIGYKNSKIEIINTLFVWLASSLICFIIWLAFLGLQTSVQLIIFGALFGVSLNIILFGSMKR